MYFDDAHVKEVRTFLEKKFLEKKTFLTVGENVL